VSDTIPGVGDDGPPALEVHGLGFRYGRHVALEDVDLVVPVGRFVALLGANGAGKTTLFSIVTGLFAAGDGQVRMLGHSLATETGHALATLGVVFQRPTLDADLTVVQNLRYFADLHGLSRGAARRRIDESLERHGIAAFARRRVTTLSGGERRRVELARALLHRPALLLCDEPTVGLDAPSRTAFVRHVRELAASEGVGVLWATHLFDEIDVGDRAVLLTAGRVSGSGELAELLLAHGAGDAASLFAALASPGARPERDRDSDTGPVRESASGAGSGPAVDSGRGLGGGDTASGDRA